MLSGKEYMYIFGECNSRILKVKNVFCMCREFQSLMLVNLIRHAESESDLFLYARNL